MTWSDTGCGQCEQLHAERDQAAAEIERLQSFHADERTWRMDAERQRDEAIAALRELMEVCRLAERHTSAYQSARRLLNQKEGT